MSTTGVCPYCGKTFKRLKSHLPHCKAKEPSRTQHDVTGSKEAPVKNQLTTKSENASRLSTVLLSGSLPPSTPLQSESESFSSPSLMSSPESMSRPTSSKKKTQRLADQIEMDTLTSSILSAPLPSPSKPMNNTSGALKETARSKQVTTGPLKQAQPKPQPISSDQLPAAFCPAIDTVTSGTLLSTRRQALLAPEAKLEGASKSKRMNSKSLLTTEMSSLSENRIPFGGVVGTGETPTMFLEDGGVQNVNGAHVRATLQNVKDTLRRSKGIGQPGKLSLLEHIQTSLLASDDRQPVETEVGGPLGVSRDPTGVQAPLRNANGIGLLFTCTSPSNQLPDTSSQVRGLSPVERVSTSHPEKEGFTQAGTIYSSPPTLTPQVTALQSSLTSAAAVVGSTDGLIQRHRYEMTLLPASSSVTRPAEGAPALASSSSSLHYPSCPLNLSVNKQSGGVSDRIIMKHPEVHIGNLKLKNAIEGNLAGRRLAQVRLGELPLWLAIKTPSRPREAVEALQRGWLWYYRRYINVKRGGVGGVSMLLAGYCVLGYVWNYPHIKCDRWRKYH